MNIETWEDRILAYVEGDLEGTERLEVEAAIAGNEELQRLHDLYASIDQKLGDAPIQSPSERSKARFVDMIAAADKKPKTINVSWRSLLQIAAAVLLVFGTSIYIYTTKQNEDVLSAQLAEVNAKMDALLQDASPSERIRAINVANEVDDRSVNVKMITTLIGVMENDPSSNVRLTAVESLTQYVERDEVRSALVKALGVEQDMAIQLAIIHAIARRDDKKTRHILEDIINNENSRPNIKEEASMQLKHLINI